MKTKYLIGLIIISGLVIIYNQQNQTKKYLFKQDIKQENITPVHSRLGTSIDEHEFLCVTGKILLSYQSLQDSSFLLRYYDLSKDTLQKQMKRTLHTPQILFTQLDSIFYIDQFELYSLNTENKSTSQISHKPTYLYNAYPLGENQYISLGTASTIDGHYDTGFYLINNGNAVLLQTLETASDSTSIAINSLVYSGKFTKSKRYVIYYCDKMSNIYLFDLKGNFITEVHTKENAPKPNINYFNGFYLYKRGYTFQTNLGVYEHDNYLYVFSFRTEQPQLVADKYSIKERKYISSFVVNKDFNNESINQVFQYGDSVIISSQDKFIFFRI